MANIEIPLLPAQLELIESEKNTIVFISGRGGGKTVSGALKVVLELIADPGTIAGCFSPTHSQAHQTQLPAIVKHCETLGIETCWNKNPGWYKKYRFMDFQNVLSLNIPGSKYASHCYLGSSERFNNVRGKELDLLWLDEARDIDLEAYHVFIGCLRGNRRSQQGAYKKILTTTPCGFDAIIYENFIKTPKPDTHIITSKSSDNIFLPDGFVDELLNNYSEKFAQQEIYGQIINFQENQVVYAFDHNRHLKQLHEVAPIANPLMNFLSIDINVAPMCWAYGLYNKEMIYMDGEIVMSDNANTEEAAYKALRAMECHLKNDKFITLCGDASAKNRSTRSVSNDYEIICRVFNEAGIKVNLHVPPANPPQRDRANVFNIALERSKLFFNPSVKQIIKDMQNLTYKDNTTNFDKIRYDGHIFDALSYFVYLLFNTNKRSGVSAA